MSEVVQPKLISGNSNITLSKGIASWASSLSRTQIDLVKGRVEQFNDQEIFVEVYENVRNEDMFVIQSTSNPANDNLMELLIITDALRRSSAKRITAVIPYFGYARQDRRTKARTPITAKLIANLLTGAGIERVLTLDLHSTQIQGFFDIPVDNLYASPIFALDIFHNFSDPDMITVISPDVGGVARARGLAERINAELAVVDKRRNQPGEIAAMHVIGEVKNKICLIVDDICDTAGTLVKAADLLIEKGASQVHAYISHGVFSDPAIKRIESSSLSSLVVCDSISAISKIKDSKKIRLIPTAPLFAQAVLNIAHGNSVSSLFDSERLSPIYKPYYPKYHHDRKKKA
ncbi:MAG: phosphoribosylpyrophosphate synthetase [Rhodobacteraceae bacterium]|nr:MAG: phosphoribosylpyrophosphate synthetase [Paracoccaceae bacterium]